MSQTWHEYESGLWIAFSFPCEEIYGVRWNALKCKCKTPNHGHLQFATDDDGWAWIHFPVESLEGLTKVIDALALKGKDYEKGGAYILAQPEVLILPKEMTEKEKAIIVDDVRFQDLLKHVYASP